jgi:hypothetical protein
MTTSAFISFYLSKGFLTDIDWVNGNFSSIPAYDQKIDPRSNTLFGRENSLFGKNNSLFRQKNSLFHLLGNFAASI